MRGMLNDVNTNFKGRLEVVDVAESKKESELWQSNLN